MKTDNRLPEKECGVAKTLKLIGSKWTMLILHNLFDGKKRFGELQTILDGISSKTLSERLNSLENEGFIHKKIYAEIPLHVEYSLTKKGLSLSEIFKTMQEWGDQS